MSLILRSASSRVEQDVQRNLAGVWDSDTALSLRICIRGVWIVPKSHG